MFFSHFALHIDGSDSAFAKQMSVEEFSWSMSVFVQSSYRTVNLHNKVPSTPVGHTF